MMGEDSTHRELLNRETLLLCVLGYALGQMRFEGGINLYDCSSLLCCLKIKGCRPRHSSS
jgi:hypothetical protein